MQEPSPLWPHTGAILISEHRTASITPAEGRRMWNGKTLIEHVLRALLRVCRNVVIVGTYPGLVLPEDPRILRIAESMSDPNPLVGLRTLLAAKLDTDFLVATCDQPFLTIPLLRRLTEGRPDTPHLFMIPRGTSFHPFPGFYPASLLPTVEIILASEKPRMRELIRKSTPLWIPLSDREEYHLLRINNPDQLDRLQRLAGHNTVSY
jgi:molybdopterin-guanine dinucleotide biosynthesis protein A